MMALGISVFIIVIIFLCYVLSGEKSDGLSTHAPVSSSNYPGGKGGVNNPGYLIHRDDVNWKGEESSEGCKFENFSNLTWGARAWYVNLFGKYKDGTIKSTSQMIDVLTPASSENSERARNNYKAHVAQAKNWIDLGFAVFEFEANPDWVNSGNKIGILNDAFKQAVDYKFCGNVPPYFIK